ncbi:hypothetical protein JFV29_06760 [Peribacillus sp. TH16]|uniref:hypothetical protein n=1 Tax=unclassified Peribacillus TaxID=2675266 RepID=UPI0019133355|nr:MULTISPECIES: hypothetical protein [unclassified Peribacillus]MBK5445451.1 hypothetical protein [Peribacillus sp. TH24]MBK5481638.1 hypothetical protein [Peribacillus sp. TH16]
MNGESYNENDCYNRRRNNWSAAEYSLQVVYDGFSLPDCIDQSEAVVDKVVEFIKQNNIFNSNKVAVQ